MFKKLLRESGIAALAIGLISSITGVDIAPDDVDKVITGIAVILIYAPQLYAGLKARFAKKVS